MLESKWRVGRTADKSNFAVLVSYKLTGMARLPCISRGSLIAFFTSGLLVQPFPRCMVV